MSCSAKIPCIHYFIMLVPSRIRSGSLINSVVLVPDHFHYKSPDIYQDKNQVWITMPKNSEVRSKSIPEWCGYTRLVSNSVNFYIKSKKVRVNFIRPNADPVFFQVSNPNPDFSNFQIRIRIFFQVSNPDQVFWSSESGSGSFSKFWIRMRFFLVSAPDPQAW